MNKCKHVYTSDDGTPDVPCAADATREGFCWRHRPANPGVVEREEPRRPRERYRSIRLQVYLPENLVQWLDDEAARRGIFVSTLIRQYIGEAKDRAEG